MTLFGGLGVLRDFGDRATIYVSGAHDVAASVYPATAGARQILAIGNREWVICQQPESIIEAMAPIFLFDGSSQKYPYCTLYQFTLL